jgi:hypothetical protein
MDGRKNVSACQGGLSRNTGFGLLPLRRGIFETFVQIYDDHFSGQNGFWQPYLETVIYRYSDCGDQRNGFARVKCKDYGHEYLLAFFCKRCLICLPNTLPVKIRLPRSKLYDTQVI